MHDAGNVTATFFFGNRFCLCYDDMKYVAYNIQTGTKLWNKTTPTVIRNVEADYNGQVVTLMFFGVVDQYYQQYTLKDVNKAVLKGVYGRHFSRAGMYRD